MAAFTANALTDLMVLGHTVPILTMKTMQGRTVPDPTAGPAWRGCLMDCRRTPMAPAAPVVPHPVTGAGVTPLPRPRPPEIASRKAADEAKRSAASATDAKPSLAVDPKPDIKPDPKPTVTTAAPVVPPSPAPQAAPPPTAPAKPGKAPSTLTINN